MIQVPDQSGLTLKQIKNEASVIGTINGDPLGYTAFHPPLYASTWGAILEATIATATLDRRYKDLVRSPHKCVYCPITPDPVADMLILWCGFI